MKKILVFATVGLWLQIAFATGSEVRNVKAIQQYPWGKVYITYDVVGDIHSGADWKAAPFLVVTAKYKTTGEILGTVSAKDIKYLSGDTGNAIGPHKIVWDVSLQGIKINSHNTIFTVAYEEGNPLYCVIDLSAGPDAESYPVSYLLDVPSGGWTYKYKTSKLVLRRIEPGDIPTRDARITKQFYIGIFEVTQSQYAYVMGNNPSDIQLHSPSQRPVESVSYDTIRGSFLGSYWPEYSYVDSSSFIGKIRAKTGISGLDLPTEAQWEYACRAGTTSIYNNGGDSSDDLKLLGRYRGNSEEGDLHFQYYHVIVGSYQPNAWGLYDMHGNVSEWCLDRYGDSGFLSGDDPVGAASSNYRVVRGGWYSGSASDCTSDSRRRQKSSDAYNFIGFRLACSTKLL